MWGGRGGDDQFIVLLSIPRKNDRCGPSPPTSRLLLSICFGLTGGIWFCQRVDCTERAQCQAPPFPPLLLCIKQLQLHPLYSLKLILIPLKHHGHVQCKLKLIGSHLILHFYYIWYFFLHPDTTGKQSSIFTYINTVPTPPIMSIKRFRAMANFVAAKARGAYTQLF